MNTYTWPNFFSLINTAILTVIAWLMYDLRERIIRLERNGLDRERRIGRLEGRYR